MNNKKIINIKDYIESKNKSDSLNRLEQSGSGSFITNPIKASSLWKEIIKPRCKFSIKDLFK